MRFVGWGGERNTRTKLGAVGNDSKMEHGKELYRSNIKHDGQHEPISFGLIVSYALHGAIGFNPFVGSNGDLINRIKIQISKQFLEHETAIFLVVGLARVAFSRHV